LIEVYERYEREQALAAETSQAEQATPEVCSACSRSFCLLLAPLRCPASAMSSDNEDVPSGV
jgi:hypothetical protein